MLYVEGPSGASTTTPVHAELDENEVPDNQEGHLPEMYLDYLFHGLVALFGVFSNTINIFVLVKIGLKDSMSIGLLCLSITDLLVAFTSLGESLCDLLNLLYPASYVDLNYLSFNVFGWTRTCTQLISSWVTAVISVERCLCVVYPFRVKQIFTRARCICLIVAIYAVHTGIYMPIYVSFQISVVDIVQSSPSTTWPTRGVYRLNAVISEEYQLIVDLITSVGLSLICQSIVLLCTCYMIYGLRTSSNVRKNTTASHSLVNAQNTSSLTKKNTASCLSHKEKKLVQVALVLALCSSICCLPRFTSVFAYYTLPRNSLLFYILSSKLWSVSTMIGLLFSSSTFLIYVFLGSNYKTVFVQCFTC